MWISHSTVYHSTPVIRSFCNSGPTVRPFSHWKLISKLMLISSFRKKISGVNSQLSKEIN